jgi:hypothetical protein
MSKASPALWSLDPKDVLVSQTSSASGGRKALRQSRELDVRSSTLVLKHLPTGISVSATVRAGNYSRSEMQRHKAELERTLRIELQDRVARHLRIAGR